MPSPRKTKGGPDISLSEGKEALALQIAEQSDLSVNQAKELIRRHGGDLKKIKEVAKTYKAES